MPDVHPRRPYHRRADMNDSLIATRARRRGWRIAALLGAGAALISLAFVSWTDLRDSLRVVDRDLASTAADLDTSSVRLIRRYTALAEARADLTASREALRQRTAARDATEDRVLATQAKLERTNGLINDESSDLWQREANLALLSRCFVGASEALNQIAVADIAGFTSTLREVNAACSSARADL